jgi:hypothetical protein
MRNRAATSLTAVRPRESALYAIIRTGADARDQQVAPLPLQPLGPCREVAVPRGMPSRDPTAWPPSERGGHDLGPTAARDRDCYRQMGPRERPQPHAPAETQMQVSISPGPQSRLSPNLRTSGLRCPATQACRRAPPFLVRRVQRDGQFVVGVGPVPVDAESAAADRSRCGRRGGQKCGRMGGLGVHT